MPGERGEGGQWRHAEIAAFHFAAPLRFPAGLPASGLADIGSGRLLPALDGASWIRGDVKRNRPQPTSRAAPARQAVDDLTDTGDATDAQSRIFDMKAVFSRRERIPRESSASGGEPASPCRAPADPQLRAALT